LDHESCLLEMFADSGEDLQSREDSKQTKGSLHHFAGVASDDEVLHSDDFRSVRWYGTMYFFTANQAHVIRLLHKNWLAGTPDVGNETLLLAVDREAPPARLDALFRDNEAWGKMIVAGETKGTHRLSTPAK